MSLKRVLVVVSGADFQMCSSFPLPRRERIKVRVKFSLTTLTLALSRQRKEKTVVIPLSFEISNVASIICLN
ncbi:MAG: hypothetical protein WCA51_05795 [Dehalococcoidia bacterium]